MTRQTFFIADDSDIVAARRRARELAAVIDLSTTQAEALATALTEVARNLLVHARNGTLSVALAKNGDWRGIEVVARDDGPGIPDVERALEDGYSTSAGLGLGLPSARRLVDEFEIASKPSNGTTIVLRQWARAMEKNSP